LECTARELQGLLCIALELAPARKQEIACTRSFGQPLTHLVDLGEAVTKFTSRAAHKLRAQGSLASQVLVFIRTSPFRPEAQFSRSISMPLRRPCADTSVIAAAALRGLRAIYRQGYQLAMAGACCWTCSPARCCRVNWI
jgi:DNA polymerase V